MGLNEADKARFATVLKNIKYDHLASFASTVRHCGHHSTGIISVPSNPQPISCRYLSKINCGSYHVVINLLFADGAMWVLKIPGTGHKEDWDTISAHSLGSEAQTMRLIRRETSVPVPEVYAFDASVDNELGCPYILMEMIHGKPLYEVWFDEDVSQNKLEEYRARALQGIAGAMSQLNRLTFSEGGALVFDDEGLFAGMGGSKAVDLEALYEKLQSEHKATPFYLREPFKDPKSYFQAMLDRRGRKKVRSVFDRGVYDLLSHFIDWSLADSSTFQDKPFVLSHPDFDTQNILVTSDGTLAGFIDWDWVSAVPSCIGCQRYPLFLIQDYDPVNYDYDIKAGKPYEGYDANSPAELACYRAIYAQFMETCLIADEQARMNKGPQQAARVRKARKEAANITRRSLVIGILELAASAPHLTTRIMMNMFGELERLTAAEWDADSSTTGSEDGCGSDDDEVDGNAGTEPSEVDDTISVAERKQDQEDIKGNEANSSTSVDDKVCTDKPQSGRDTEKVEAFSIDDLFNEIEKLTMLSPFDGFSPENAADQVCPYATRPIETVQTVTKLDGQDSNSGIVTVDPRKPRLARVCGWAQNKLRHRAEKLHRKAGPKISKGPRKPKLARAYRWAQKKLQDGAERLQQGMDAEVRSENPAIAPDEEGPSSSRKAKATQTLRSWTEQQLRQAIDILHCNEGLVAEGDIKYKADAVRKGGLEEIVEWLQGKLKKLLQALKENVGVNNDASSKNQVAPNSPAFALPKRLTKDEKREICCQVSLMARNNKMPLTFEHQVSIARWMIETLQNGPCPPSQPVDHAIKTLPLNKEINKPNGSSNRESGCTSGSETNFESEVSGVRTLEDIFDATEELHSSQGNAKAEATNQDTRAVHRGTSVSKICDVHIGLGLEGKADEQDEAADEDDEYVGHGDFLADDYKFHNGKETLKGKVEGTVAKLNGPSLWRPSTAHTTEIIQNPGTNSSATNGEKPQNDERLHPDRPNTNLEDDGSFHMPCVCIALAKGDLDKQRMQRLKDGFFALLNQTL